MESETAVGSETGTSLGTSATSQPRGGKGDAATPLADVSSGFDDRCFSPDPNRRALARAYFARVRELPIVAPHGHIDPWLLADPDARLGNPADLFIIPDHYVFRMLHSQGVPLQKLGVPTRDGSPVESDPRVIWQRFAENFHLFRGTPTGLWLRLELEQVFDEAETPTEQNAQVMYDRIQARLDTDAYRPRALFDRFGIEVLTTTDAATDTLAPHAALREQRFFKVRPTFRPDAVVDLGSEGWSAAIARLSQVADIDVTDYRSYELALAQRRAEFQKLGAVATDHAAMQADIEPMPSGEASTIFERALAGDASAADAARFTAHMLHRMAAMSAEDGLVMQFHVGSFRNHDRLLHRRFGNDKGADIPVATSWTRPLRTVLNDFGSNDRFRMILFTLDESSYARELAPLAGHYPSLLLGPPWWFFDSVKGMERYLDAVMETAGAYNTAGFNDDTRAFASIPARHEVWRRVTCNWLADMTARGLMDEHDGHALARAFAYDLAKRAYRLS